MVVKTLRLAPCGKLHYFVIVALFFNMASISLSSANNNNNEHTIQMPVQGLEGVGINTIALWSGVTRISSPQQFIDHIRPMEDFGFSHIVLISCLDWIIELSCKKGINKARIMEFVKAAINETNLHIVLSLKAYDQKKIDGKNTSKFQTALESDPAVEIKFVDAWKSIALELQHIPKERLSFNILNEPEFELPKVSNRKRTNWLNIASKTIKGIREVSPDRVIIVEGIGKSLFASRKKSKYKYSSIEQLIRPLNYSNLIYGFHNYEPNEFNQQASYRSGVFGKPHTKMVTTSVKKDAARLLKWSVKHKVPVILSETGCIGYYDGKTEGPKNPDDCGKFASDVYSAYVENGIPITWWALEKEKTIYLRDRPTDKYWLPKKLIPDPSLFTGLKLNNPLKEVAKEAQKLLKKEIEYSDLPSDAKMICTNALGEWNRDKLEGVWISRAQELGLLEHHCRDIIKR